MTRRKLVALMAAIFAAPLAVQAQQTSRRRIGVLMVGLSPESTEALMLQEWGDEWDRKTLAAEAAWSKLPPAEQREWTRSKLRYHPNVWRFLASVGERLKRGA